MKISNSFFLLLTLIITSTNIFCQTHGTAIEKQIIDELDSVRNGSIKTNDYAFDSTNELKCLSVIKKYDNDENEYVRFRTRILKMRIAKKTKNHIIREKIIEEFVNDASDSIADLSQYANSRLIEFQEEDFSEKAKVKLASSLKNGNYDPNFILLCGIAQVTETIPLLNQLSLGFNERIQNWYNTTGWFASLALARMNNYNNIKSLIIAVESVQDPVLRLTKLLRYLAYTRQYQCILLLKKYLYSSERLPDIEGRPGVEFNQVALDCLAQYIQNFPVKYKEYGYSNHEIEIARSFLQNKN